MPKLFLVQKNYQVVKITTKEITMNYYLQNPVTSAIQISLGETNNTYKLDQYEKIIIANNIIKATTTITC